MQVREPLAVDIGRFLFVDSIYALTQICKPCFMSIYMHDEVLLLTMRNVAHVMKHATHVHESCTDECIVSHNSSYMLACLYTRTCVRMNMYESACAGSHTSILGVIDQRAFFFINYTASVDLVVIGSVGGG